MITAIGGGSGGGTTTTQIINNTIKEEFTIWNTLPDSTNILDVYTTNYPDQTVSDGYYQKIFLYKDYTYLKGNVLKFIDLDGNPFYNFCVSAEVLPSVDNGYYNLPNNAPLTRLVLGGVSRYRAVNSPVQYTNKQINVIRSYYTVGTFATASGEILTDFLSDTNNQTPMIYTGAPAILVAAGCYCSNAESIVNPNTTKITCNNNLFITPKTGLVYDRCTILNPVINQGDLMRWGVLTASGNSGIGGGFVELIFIVL